jgi:hypothetical protein
MTGDRTGLRIGRPHQPANPRRVPIRGHQPKHAPRVPFALLVVGLIVGGLCALLALNTASAANELNRHGLATKDSDVAAQVEQLRNQVAKSAAPGSLGSAAAALGMVPAGAPAFLRVGANGKVTVLGSPAPATSPPTPPPPPPPPTPTPTKTKHPTKTTGKKTATTSKSHAAPSTPITTLPGGTR